MAPNPQLAFAFPHQPNYAAADFLQAGSNEAAVTWLARMPEWPNGQLALWGGPGRGKTHLLHLWAERTGAPLLAGPQVEGLPELADTPALALDDADQAAEEPLLHLLNAAREARRPVLLAAIAPPARWPVQLPDLASRLRAITAVEIAAPEESLLRSLLLRLLADRQLAVPAPVQDWLLLHLPRSPAALHVAVDRLDRAALACRSRISRSLAAEVLSDLLRDEGPLQCNGN